MHPSLGRKKVDVDSAVVKVFPAVEVAVVSVSANNSPYYENSSS